MKEYFFNKKKMIIVILNNGFKLPYTQYNKNSIPTGYHIWHSINNTLINIDLQNRITNIVIVQKSKNNPHSYTKYYSHQIPIKYRIKKILNTTGMCRLKRKNK